MLELNRISMEIFAPPLIQGSSEVKSALPPLMFASLHAGLLALVHAPGKRKLPEVKTIVIWLAQEAGSTAAHILCWLQNPVSPDGVVHLADSLSDMHESKLATDAALHVASCLPWCGAASSTADTSASLQS